MDAKAPSVSASSPPPVTADSRLIVVKREPFNAETPLAEQIGVVTPNALFYVRGNFAMPRLDVADWALTVGGEVERQLRLTYDELRALPSRSLLVTLECAGNGRSYLQPRVEGEPWRYGAVGTAEWTGVPLGTVLAAAGLTPAACEIVVQGADRGHVANVTEPIHFARSLGLEKALDSDTLLAYAMNGEPLPVEHGFPVRLLVPGWYGMASVKWVTHVAAIASRFQGYYQTQRYVLARSEREDTMAEPVTTMAVRSLIAAPASGAVLPRGQHRLRGFAWSGSAPVTRVEVSVDGGASWEPAEFVSDPERYAWRRWEYAWQTAATGPATLHSRAFDAHGCGQPTTPDWNRLGYANNAIQAVHVTVLE